MITVEELEKFVLELPEAQRASLASHILDSLPPLLADEDGGMAEALRRDAELDAKPGTGISLPDFNQRIRKRY
jgi:putative addiction module component (TIGR02574 family)